MPRNATVTIQTNTPSKTTNPNASKAAGRGGRRNAQVNVNIQNSRGRSRNPRPPRNSQKLSFPNKDRSMVSVPKDSHSAVGASGPKQQTLDNIKQIVSQSVNPAAAATIVRTPAVQNWKSHCSKFNKVISLTPVTDVETVLRFTPSPEMLEVASTGPTTVASMVIEGEAIALGFKGELSAFSDGVLTGRVRSYLYNGYQVFPVQDYPGTPTQIVFQSGSMPTAVGNWSAGAFAEIAPSGAGLNTFVLSEGASQWYPIYGNLGTLTSTWDNINYAAPVGTFFTPVPIDLPATTQTLKCAFGSLLVSYAGSSLVNQGQIVMAMTDPGWRKQGPSFFDALSALPDRRYNGVLRKGAYGWWTPLNLNEANPQPIEYWDRKPELSELWCAVKGGDPTASLKVEVTAGFEFYAPEQIYSHVPAPMRAPIHDYLSAMFLHLPHCMENDTHDDMTRGIIAKVHKSIMTAVRDPVSLGLGVLAMA